MTTTKQKRDLFGGTLRCAGLAAAGAMTASAMADFMPAETPPGYLPTLSYATATGTPGNPYFFNYTYAAEFAAPIGYIADGLSMNVYAGATTLSASLDLLDSGLWSYARVQIVQWFTVDVLKEAAFEWDFTTTSYGRAYVYQLGVGTITPIVSEGTAGSELVSLTSGNTYAILFNLTQMDGAEGGGFVTLTWIPAPGGFALLGLGMLGVKRRRRE